MYNEVEYAKDDFLIEGQNNFWNKRLYPIFLGY